MNRNKYPGAVGANIEIGRRRSSNLLHCACNLHGVRTRVITNSGAVADAMGEFLGAFPAGNDETADAIIFLFVTPTLEDEMIEIPDGAHMLYDWGMIKIMCDGEYRYEKVNSRARVIADVRNGIAAGFAEEDLLQSNWLVTNLFFYPLWAQLMKENGLFPLHAAGLVKNGKSVLFLGKSGSGKSTLSIHLVRSGYGLLSDDTVFLREAGGKVESMSFPEEINVTRKTIEMIPDLSSIENFTVNPFRDKSSFPIDELYPGCIVDLAVPSVLIFPQLADSTNTIIEPMDRSEALTLSMRYGFFFMDPSTTSKHFELLASLVKQVRCYRMYSGTDQMQLESKVDELLQQYL